MDELGSAPEAVKPVPGALRTQSHHQPGESERDLYEAYQDGQPAVGLPALFVIVPIIRQTPQGRQLGVPITDSLESNSD